MPNIHDFIEGRSAIMHTEAGPQCEKGCLSLLHVILYVSVARISEDTVNNNVNLNKWPKKDTAFFDLKQCVELVGVCQQPKLLCMKISFN